MSIHRNERPIETIVADLAPLMWMLQDAVLDSTISSDRAQETREAYTKLLAEKIYLFVLEHRCFRNVCSISNLEQVLSLESSLVRRGCQLYCTSANLSSIGIIPTLPMDLPWAIVETACRLYSLCRQNRRFWHSPEYQGLIAECLEERERYPRYREPTQLLLDTIHQMELRRKIDLLVAPVFWCFDFWSVFNFSTRWSMPAMKLLLKAKGDYESRCKAITARQGEGCSTDQWHMIHRQAMAEEVRQVQFAFVSSVRQAIAMYDREVLPKARASYPRCYRQLKSLECMTGTNINRLILESIRREFLTGFRPQSSQLAYAPAYVIDAVEGFDINEFPQPDSFSWSLPYVHFPSVVEECAAEYDSEKQLQMDLLSGISSGVVEQERHGEKKPDPELPSCSAASCSHTRREESFLAHPEEQYREEALFLRLTETVWPVERPSARSAPLEEDEKRSTRTAFQINDGPRPQIRYSDRAARWADAGRDVFAEDPHWRETRPSEVERREIRFHHGFGRALLPVIIAKGRLYEKKGLHGSLLRKSYTLPGDITRPDGQYEKVVFTVSVNPRTGEILHMIATRKTPVELIMEYAEHNFFQPNEEELDRPVRKEELCARAPYPLPSDGSRIHEITNDSVGVMQADGTVLRVYALV